RSGLASGRVSGLSRGRVARCVGARAFRGPESRRPGSGARRLRADPRGPQRARLTAMDEWKDALGLFITGLLFILLFALGCYVGLATSWPALQNALTPETQFLTRTAAVLLGAALAVILFLRLRGGPPVSPSLQIVLELRRPLQQAFREAE